MSSHEKWLRQAAEVLTDRNMTAIANTCVQAADAIAWLQAEVERLNKSLDVAAACATDKNRQFAEMQRRIDHLESCQKVMLDAMKLLRSKLSDHVSLADVDAFDAAIALGSTPPTSVEQCDPNICKSCGGFFVLQDTFKCYSLNKCRCNSAQTKGEQS